MHSLWVFSAFSLGLITGVSGTKTLVDQHRPFHFLWADQSDNTLLLVFNSAEPTVALPCMAGLVSLSFGRLKFRAW